MSVRGRSAHTVKSYGADLRMFLAHAGDVPIEEFEDRAMEWLNVARKEKAPKTVRRYLGTLRMFGRWAGLTNPLHDYLAPRPAQPVPHPLHEGRDGVDRMLDVARSDEEVALVALTALVGLRVSEAVSVLALDVDALDRTLRVRGKGDKERIVPLSNKAMSLLAPRLEVAGMLLDKRLAPYHERTARKKITALGERAGLARSVASHDLRATFATEAYAKTKNLRAVQDLLGHSDSRTTQVYTGVSMDDMRSAAAAMEE